MSWLPIVVVSLFKTIIMAELDRLFVKFIDFGRIKQFISWLTLLSGLSIIKSSGVVELL